jgi:predicted AAA+ superfamily ATPase
MRYLHRELESQLLKASRSFPTVVLTGPRRAGKTCLNVCRQPHAGGAKSAAHHTPKQPAASHIWEPR